jgi:hypothetical protein
MRFSHAFVSALLASVAIGQIPIPPHSVGYTGFTRGFQFTAQSGFFIVGLDLPLDAFQAGDGCEFGSGHVTRPA